MGSITFKGRMLLTISEQYHSCVFILFTINKTAWAIPAFAWVLFGTSHPNVLTFSILHLLHNQQIPNELERVCPKGTSCTQLPLITSLTEAIRQLLLILGITEILKKRLSSCFHCGCWCWRVHSPPFIWGDHLPGRKREPNSCFLKCYKIVWGSCRLAQLQTVAALVLLLLWNTMGQNLILPLKKNPICIDIRKGWGKKNDSHWPAL